MTAISGSITDEISIALTRVGGVFGAQFFRTELWREKALECLIILHRVYEFLHAQRDPHLTQEVIFNNFHLDSLEGFAWDLGDMWHGRIVRPRGYFGGTYGVDWQEAVMPLQNYIQGIEGYDPLRIGKQRPEVMDHYRFVVRQLAQIVCANHAGRFAATDHVSMAHMVTRLLESRLNAGKHHE